MCCYATLVRRNRQFRYYVLTLLILINMQIASAQTARLSLSQAQTSTQISQQKPATLSQPVSPLSKNRIQPNRVFEARPSLSANSLSSASPEPLLGIYIFGLRNFNMAKDSFEVDFWVWTLGPPKTSPKTLEMINARSIDRILPTSSKRGSRIWRTRRVRAEIFYDWDTYNLPFDRHQIVLLVEEGKNEGHTLKYLLDAKSSGLSPDVKVDGWIIEDCRISVDDYRYNTNFGDPNLTGSSQYSRLTVTLDVRRDGTTMFWKLHTGVYVAMAVTLLSFMMKVSQATVFSGRMGLLAGTLFAVVINLRSAESTTGLSNSLTLTDKIHIVTMLFIFGAALIAVLSRRAVERHDEEGSRILDRKMLKAFAWNYVMVNAVLIALALWEG